MTENVPPIAAHRRRPLMLALLAVFVVLALGVAVYGYAVARFHETTDDAYVNGYRVFVHAQRAGTVSAVHVDDGDRVEQGQTLLELDDTDARVQLQKASTAGAEIISQVRAQCADVAVKHAVLEQSDIRREQAEGDLKRRLPLLGGQALAPEDLVHARLAVQQAEQAYQTARQEERAAQARAGNCDLRHQAQIEHAYTEVLAAELSLLRSQLPAPWSGVIAERRVQLGQQVAPGDDLLAVIPLQSVWVDANLKEGQLRHVRVGQPATVIIDQYGSKLEFPGRVIGIAAGSGSAFSLLPPQNAVGNWIKVVQRVPVRIAIDPGYLQRYPLRLGLSAEVDIDTHDRRGAVLGSLPLAGRVDSSELYHAQLAQARRAAEAWLQKALQSSVDAGTGLK